MWHLLQAADKVKDALSGSGGGGEVRSSAISCLEAFRLSKYLACMLCGHVFGSVCLGVPVAALLQACMSMEVSVKSCGYRDSKVA